MYNIVLALIGVLGLTALGTITRHYLYPDADSRTALSQKSRSPIADIIGGRSAIGSMRQTILPILTIITGLAFFLLDDTVASTQSALLFIGVLVTLIAQSNLTEEARVNVFGTTDKLARNGVLFSVFAAIIGVGSQLVDTTTRNYYALSAIIVLSLLQGSLNISTILTALAVGAAGFYLAGNRTNQGLALIIGGVVALFPTIVSQFTRNTLGVTDLLARLDPPQTLARQTIIDSADIRPVAAGDNPLRTQGATQRFNFQIPNDIPQGVSPSSTFNLFSREGHFTMRQNPRRGEIFLETFPTETDPSIQRTFTWNAPVNTPIELLLSMGEKGLAVAQNGVSVAKTGNLTFVPERQTNLVCGQSSGIAAELLGLQFMPLPISSAQMTYFQYI